MVVSIPVNHPDAPPRNGMVRGYYESIEMIREIPLSGAEDPETNPVEWIMVTRSDPGGGIPRFMVERNVPSSIVQDAVKFLDWACPVTEIQDEVPASKDGLPATETAHEPEHRLSVAEVRYRSRSRDQYSRSPVKQYTASIASSRNRNQPDLGRSSWSAERHGRRICSRLSQPATTHSLQQFLILVLIH
jgi:hypothetical protein